MGFLGRSLLDHKPTAPAQESSSGETTASAVATTATETATDVVPPAGLPLRLRIPSIGVDAPVVSVGVTDAGNMASPGGADEVGWYDRGVRPGEVGSAVMAGHSGYKSKAAVFDNLTSVRPGDLLYVDYAEGKTLVFRVRECRTYARDAKASEVFSSGDGVAHVNLVTCTGAWDAAAGTHTQRLVVFTDACAQP